MTNEQNIIHLDIFDEEAVTLIKRQRIKHLAFSFKFSCSLTQKKPFDLVQLLQFNDILEKLSLHGCNYSNLEKMFNEMPKLTYLDVDTQKIDFSLINKNSTIESLHSEGTKTKEWNDITKLNSLKDLYINGNIALENIDFLLGLNNLEKLRLYNCSKITSVPDLSNLKKLKWVSMEICNRLEDISELKKLEGVEIHVSGKMIKGGYHCSTRNNVL
jgi:hypothetical protein